MLGVRRDGRIRRTSFLSTTPDGDAFPPTEPRRPLPLPALEPFLFVLSLRPSPRIPSSPINFDSNVPLTVALLLRRMRRDPMRLLHCDGDFVLLLSPLSVRGA
jgi:hypothetical protein